MPTQVPNHVQLRIITKAESPYPVDTFELIKITPAGDGLEGPGVGGLQDGVARANGCGSCGFVDLDVGVADDVPGTGCTAGVDLDSLLPDSQQGCVIKEDWLALYLDAGMAEQLCGFDQLTIVQAFGVSVEQVADVYGADTHDDAH